VLYYLDRWLQDIEELGALWNLDEEHVFLSEGSEALTIHSIEMLFKRLRARTGAPSSLEMRFSTIGKTHA
jgi:hypothetical protein